MLPLACDDSSAANGDSPGGRLYITSGATDEVLVLDALDGRVLERFVTKLRRDEVDEPHGIAVAPNGEHWYVTLAHGDPTLWKFELPGDRLVGRVELGTYGAARIGITPDSRRAFIPDYYRSGQGQTSGLAVVDLHTLEIEDRPLVCSAPHDAEVDPEGARVAIACSLSDEIVVLDVESLQEISRFHVDDSPGPPGEPIFKPLNLLWSPSGDTLYVGLHAAGLIRAFDVEGTLLGSAAVGAGPAQIALTADGQTLVTANRNDSSASVIDLPAFSERERVQLGRTHPHGIALADRSQIAYVTYEGSVGSPGGVVAIDLSSAEVVWSVEAGAYTLGVAYVPR